MVHNQRWAPAIFLVVRFAGPLFRNTASASRWSATLPNMVVCQRWSAIPLPQFFPQCAATSPQFHYSATAILRQSTAMSLQFHYSATAFLAVVHCVLQFAIPQFTIPQITIHQYQYQPPLFDNFFSLKYFLKQAKKIQKSRNSILVVCLGWSAIFTSPLVRYHFVNPLNSGPKQRSAHLCTLFVKSSRVALGFVHCLFCPQCSYCRQGPYPICSQQAKALRNQEIPQRRACATFFLSTIAILQLVGSTSNRNSANF